MKHLVVLAIALASSSFSLFAAEIKPLKALYLTGGCCHDYPKQKQIITEGIKARANVEFDIVHEGGTSTKHKISVYEKPDWASAYDVIVHNECFAEVGDEAFVENVLKAHKEGKPAVLIHCTMHTFRAYKNEGWREFLGVTTFRHGPQHPLEVKNLKPGHPVMKGFPEVWKTGNEELYAIEKVWPNATPLAQAFATDTKRDMVCIWVNTYGKGKVFGTTIAHNNRTMEDPVYLDLITRGLLWSTGKLEESGKPKRGFEPKK